MGPSCGPIKERGLNDTVVDDERQTVIQLIDLKYISVMAWTAEVVLGQQYGGHPFRHFSP